MPNLFRINHFDFHYFVHSLPESSLKYHKNNKDSTILCENESPRFCEADRILSADMVRMVCTKSLIFSTKALFLLALGVVAMDSEVTWIEGMDALERSRRREVADADVERRFLNLEKSRFWRTRLGRTVK